MAEATLIYDGDCPFCSRYSRHVRLKKAIGELILINARHGGPEVEIARSHGYDLNEGMVLVMDGNYYHGAACLNRLALMSSKSDRFNRLNSFLFRSAFLSRLSYPVLRSGRNLVLWMLRRPKLSA